MKCFYVMLMMMIVMSEISFARQDNNGSYAAQTGSLRISGTPGTVQFTLSGHHDRITAVAWSPDGTKIVTSSKDETAKVWSAATGELLYTLQGINFIANFCWSPDGTKLAGSISDTTVTVWSAASGEVLFTLHDYPSYIQAVSWSPDGAKIAVAYDDDYTVLWSGSSASKLLTLGKSPSTIAILRWSQDGAKLATAGFDVRVSVWSTVSGELLFPVQHTNFVKDVDWSPDGTQIASASSDYTIVIASATTGDIQQFLVSNNSAFMSVRWHPDGKRVLATYDTGIASIWSVAGGSASATPLMTFDKKTFSQDPTTALWSPDYTKVLTTDADSTAKIWSSATGTLQLTLRAHTGKITATCWSPDGARVATASTDSTVKIWYISDASGVQDSPAPDQTSPEQAFTLFPNPTDNSLHLSCSGASATATSVQILDLLGRTAATIEVPAGMKEWTMSVSELPKGVYAVRWNGMVQKVVVR